MVLSEGGASDEVASRRPLFVGEVLIDAVVVVNGFLEGEAVHGSGGGARGEREVREEVEGKEVAVEEDVICGRQIKSE
ncbi:uncharacterized protein G2W53_012970 [Senna tora]|uniref:Uncharacterized protein n=1 Tax=Senna tora TaxID=362788 RepID=A0A834TZX9_9FABA|nr:uncharacterized protein G2W53_012970 [Senna tora]